MLRRIVVACFILCLLVFNFAEAREKNLQPEEPIQGEAVEPQFLKEESVEDVSDRVYFEKVRQLTASAEKSIDIALSEIRASDSPQDPVQLLIQDLISAEKRSVQVRIFLNTFNTSGFEGSLFLRDDTLENLRREGVEVHFVQPEYRLYGQFLIFDGEFILEGGVPWYTTSLEKGLGLATLIHSEFLAAKKRVWLELLPLWDIQEKKAEKKEGRLAVPLFLFRELKYFPTMVSFDDGDAVKIFLKLLRDFYQSQQTRLRVSLEELGQEIPADRYFERVAVRAQVVKTLERLQDQYGLLKIENREAEYAEIFFSFPGNLEPSVGVPLTFFTENYAKDLSAQALFVYGVILYKSQISGHSPVWLGSPRNVERDFPLSSVHFQSGIGELRRKNLIEVFPFSLNQGGGYKELASREFRYVLNRIPTLSERLTAWQLLRDQFGDDPFKKAREMAEIFGETEDPKVVAVYLELLKQFKEEDIRSLTQRIAVLPPSSTPELLDYLYELLSRETYKGFQLGTG